MPTPKASVRERLLAQVRALAAHADQDFLAALNSGPSAFYAPAPAPGEAGPVSPADPGQVSSAFDRTEIHEDFRRAVSDPDPGVVGDLVLSQLQGDLLASLERAYRARHRSLARDRLHAAARRRCQSLPEGSLLQGLLSYLGQVETLSKN